MTKADLQTMLDMVNRQLLTAIKASNPDMAHPEKRASIELCWAYGGVRIVRSSTQDPLMPRGTKKEAHNHLRAMSKALTIAAGC